MNKKQLIAALVAAGAFIYLGHAIFRLSGRIERIENKLGGPERIACNEKDTVERVRRSVVRIVGGVSEGSGFAIKEGGFILTNFHVVSSEPSPKIILPGNIFEIGEVIMADKDADLAVIKIKKDIPTVKFARLERVSPAENLLAVGFPLGGDLPGDSSVVRGSFSRCIKDKENDIRYILTDMTLISGISGGPMVNICGEVVGINTAGLLLGGMGIAVSADSIIERYHRMSSSEEPLRDVQRIAFHPEKNALEAVRAFYNYLKARKLEEAFAPLSDSLTAEITFWGWSRGYREMLDTTVRVIRPDREIADRIHIKLSSKDLVDDEIVYKYFEGYWDVRQEDARWLLWKPRIREIEDPPRHWFFDTERIKEIEEFFKIHEDSQEYKFDMYDISQEPGNEALSVEELYEKAKARQGD